MKSKFRTKDLVKCTYPSESQERGGDWDIEKSPCDLLSQQAPSHWPGRGGGKEANTI